MEQEAKGRNFYFDTKGVKYEESNQRMYLAVLFEYNSDEEIVESLSYVTLFADSDKEAEEKFSDFEVEEEEISWYVQGITRVSDIIGESMVKVKNLGLN